MTTLVLYADDARPVPGETFGNAVEGGTTLSRFALEFPAGQVTACQWAIPKLKGYTTGNIVATVMWGAASATSGTVDFGVSVAAVTPNTDTQDVATDAWATENTAQDTQLGTTAERLHEVDVTVSNLDSVADGDRLSVRLRRANSGTMTGAARIYGVSLAYS